MAERIATGDKAPNFDLSSTEEALLMLRDEVPRTSVLLYFFADAGSERARADLRELSAARARLAERHAKVLAISPAKMDDLRALQSELTLTFPLLRDDRGFSALYGVDAGEEGAEPAPALVLVNRSQVVTWVANPACPVGEALAQVEPLLVAEGTPTGNYPKAVINRLVDRWVN